MNHVRGTIFRSHVGNTPEGPGEKGAPRISSQGPPEIIQKSRLRNWPISSADFPMTPLKGTDTIFGPF